MADVRVNEPRARSLPAQVVDRFREYIVLDRKHRDGGLSADELDRWKVLKRFLSNQFSPGTSDDIADRRDSVRIPIRLPVSFPSDKDPGKSLLTKLSRHGAFVQTQHPLAVGERFTLRIHVEKPKRDLSVPVEVVSVGVGPSVATSRQGMGLRFAEADAAVMTQIDELYERSVG